LTGPLPAAKHCREALIKNLREKSEIEKTLHFNHPSTICRTYPSTIFRSYGAGGAGRDTLSILRIKLKLHCVQKVEPDPREIGFAFHRAGTEIGQKGAFSKGLKT
jgi:hypothetical protein